MKNNTQCDNKVKILERHELSEKKREKWNKNIIGAGGQVHGERTEHARQPDGAQDSSISPIISGTVSLRETTNL